MKRYKPFDGLPAYYADGELLVTNHRGEAATDRDVDQFFRQAGADLHRIAMEMCAYHRGRGEKLAQWQLDIELAAFGRSLRGGL